MLRSTTITEKVIWALKYLKVEEIGSNEKNAEISWALQAEVKRLQRILPELTLGLLLSSPGGAQLLPTSSLLVPSHAQKLHLEGRQLKLNTYTMVLHLRYGGDGKGKANPALCGRTGFLASKFFHGQFEEWESYCLISCIKASKVRYKESLEPRTDMETPRWSVEALLNLIVSRKSSASYK